MGGRRKEVVGAMFVTSTAFGMGRATPYDVTPGCLAFERLLGTDSRVFFGTRARPR